MQRVLILITILSCAGSLYAVPLEIASPNTAQTFAYADTTREVLGWNSKEHSFYARVTFSNDLYVSDTDPLQDETYKFEFPGVTFDPTNDTFYAKAKSGEKVPVAALHKSWLGRRIVPLPGTIFFIQNTHGKVGVTLTYSAEAKNNFWGNHWAQHNEGPYLRNLFFR